MNANKKAAGAKAKPVKKIDHEQDVQDAEADLVERTLYDADRPTLIDKLAEANKAIVALVAAVAAAALSLGVGTEDLWAQITQIVVLLLGVVGVFQVTNRSPEDSVEHPEDS